MSHRRNSARAGRGSWRQSAIQALRRNRSPPGLRSLQATPRLPGSNPPCVSVSPPTSPWSGPRHAVAPPKPHSTSPTSRCWQPPHHLKATSADSSRPAPASSSDQPPDFFGPELRKIRVLGALPDPGTGSPNPHLLAPADLSNEKSFSCPTKQHGGRRPTPQTGVGSAAITS